MGGAGNPTFQTPGVQVFVANVTLSGGDGGLSARLPSSYYRPAVAAAGAGAGGRVSLPLWRGGGRRVVGEALANGTLPAGLEGQYTADQFRLLCLAEARRRCPRPCFCSVSIIRLLIKT